MMRFRLLGPVEVRAGEDWRGIGAPKWRSVLAALLIHPGQIVSADTLIGELWRDEPPARAGNLVSIYVLRLRRLMDDPDGHLLVTRAPGYLLRVAGDDCDELDELYRLDASESDPEDEPEDDDEQDDEDEDEDDEGTGIKPEGMPHE